MHVFQVFVPFLLSCLDYCEGYKPKNLPENPSLAMSVFSKLRSKDISNVLVTTAMEKVTSGWALPFFGRVMHSTDLDDDFIYLCTATIIEERIFVTAARCIYQAKVRLTTVVLENDRLQAIAFVTPSSPTKTMFDDIGFIVVNETQRTWKSLQLYSHTYDKDFKRTDDNFLWFAKFADGFSHTVRVYGFIKEKNQNWTLYATIAKISPYVCQHFYNTDILRQAFKSDNFFVPCYHTCDLDAGYDKATCTHFAGEGYSVVDYRKGYLMGVATWGGYYSSRIGIALPVGMATVNSNNFYEDLKCAQAIKQAKVTRDSFAGVCD